MTRVEKVLTAIAAKYRGRALLRLARHDGAGHFVKTIHNGIEYADMQMIAEIYGILRDGLGMGAEGDRRRSSRDWNKGRLNSYLIEITADGARRRRPEDRQAGGRHDPRPGRPEGHRQAGR